MRGSDSRTGQLFSYVDLEARVRQHAQLRAIRGIVNDALSALAEDFAALYSPIGAILGPAMWKRTSTGRNGPTRRMLQPPILTLGSTQGTRQGSKALLYGA